MHPQTYAAFMAQTDYEIGRVLDRVKELGQEDNTLVILMIGDNGASAEGSLKGLANEVREQCGVGSSRFNLQAGLLICISKLRCASSTTCRRTSTKSTSTRSAPRPPTTTTPSVRFGVGSVLMMMCV
jgi:arylsulfatase A-like enzyme